MKRLALFRELLLISIGEQDSFSKLPSDMTWRWLFLESQKQSLVGVSLSGIERLPSEQRPPKELLIEWIGTAEWIEQLNRQQIGKIREIATVFEKGGFRSCILKGQGVAELYPQPLRRQCGDIDLWVDGSREDIVKFCRGRWQIDHVDVKNMVIDNIPDVHLEVHFIPSWFYSPFTNRKFKRWFRLQWDEQFTNHSANGYSKPTIAFNLVYCLVHIYKHQFDEGIGLRQMMDYYYLLHHSTVEERGQAYTTIRSLGMGKFAAATMHVMNELFALKYEYLLCQSDERLGEKLLEDILIGGNFGQYDKRNAHGKENRLTHGIRNIRHNVDLLLDYPSEVLWSPLWKCWHWCWRKKHGYL